MSNGANGYQAFAVIFLAITVPAFLFALHLVLALLGRPDSVWLMQWIGVM